MNEIEKRELQICRERDVVSAAVAKLEEQVKEDPLLSPVGRALLRRTWSHFADVIRKEQAKFLGVGVCPRYGTLMLALRAEHLAFITIHAVVETLYVKKTEELKGADEEEGPDKYTALSRKIGNRCRLEWFHTPEKDREKAIDAFRGVGKSSRTAATRRARAKRILDGDWGARRGDLRLGSELVALAAQAKLVSVPRQRDGYGKANGLVVVVLAPDVRRAFTERDELEVFATPFYLPMICRPNPWLGLEGGGYLTNEVEREIHLVKHWNNPKIKEGLSTGNYEVTIAAVNALQNTPWRVNQKVFPVMREACKGQLPFGKYDELLDLSFKLKICASIGDHERFYFPYQLDFRGRAYCVPPVVNPQGNDIGRALLEFADGKPLGEDGVRWLQIHLANVYGECKGSMDERVDWVLKHSEKIRESASSPLDNHWWMSASKKWRFLAAAFEWESYLLNGPRMVSHLPVLVDGTCNGFQHFSALLRDTEGAIATNLMPGKRPGDFYAKVAGALQDSLKSEVESGCKLLAVDCLGKLAIDRSLVKSAVMKTPYGITEWTIGDELYKQKFAKVLNNPPDSCRYLAKHLKMCVEKEFEQAHVASEWFKAIAKSLARPPRPQKAQGIHWTTPSGFRVIQEKWKYYNSPLTVSGIALVVYDLTKPLKLPVEGQVRGIVPNFIHSLDAAHLMLTIAHLANPSAPSNGGPLPRPLGHFSAIHDGYAVHACDVERLCEVLRLEFVKMYREPVLERFASEQEKAAGILKLPAAPQIGDFDIEQVLKSEYFFC